MSDNKDLLDLCTLNLLEERETDPSLRIMIKQRKARLSKKIIEEQDEPIIEYQCPECAGTEHDKWGEVCKECGGDGVIYVDP